MKSISAFTAGVLTFAAISAPALALLDLTARDGACAPPAKAQAEAVTTSSGPGLLHALHVLN